ncbi:MAG: hypothetical protein Q8K75_03790 [Chlamydiales bacterium]|nr:hypothetical protein [Chlamydiales bacterium]
MSDPIGMPPPAAPPPPSGPSDPAPTLNITSTNSTANTDTLSSASDAILNDSGFSINSFFKAVSDSRLSFKENLHDIEFKEADFSRKQARDAISQVSNALQKYNQLLQTYLSSKTDAGGSDQATGQLNGSANSANNSISDTQQKAGALNTQTDSYNTAADSFNTQNSAGFASPAERDAAIDDYNSSVDDYNAYAQDYNASATASNVEIDSYNAEVDSYNAQIDANNAQIDQDNIQRQQEGKAPLPHQEHEPYKDHIPLVAEKTHLPYADVTTPIEHATPVDIPTTIETKPEPSDLNFFDDFLATQFMPFFLQALNYMTSQNNLQELLLNERVRPNAGVNDITRPEAYIERKETVKPEDSGSGAGTSLASLAMGLDHSRTDAILGRGTVEQMFTLQNVDQTLPLVQLLQPFTMSMFIRSSIHGALPGLGLLETDMSKQKPEDDAIRVASSIGTTSAILGVVNSGALSQPVAEALSKTNGLQNMSAEQKGRVEKDLEAVVSSALLKLGLGSLVAETDSPGLLKSVDAALITGQPTGASEEQFAGVPIDFDALNSAYGSDTIALLLGDFLKGRLSDGGYDKATGEKIGGVVSSSLGEQGIPNSKQGLEDQVTQLLGGVLGSNIPPGLAEKIANDVSLFTLGASTKDELQSNLISKVGPQAAPGLADETLFRVFGFSADFSEPAILQRQTGEERPNSIHSILSDNLKSVQESNDGKVGAKLAEEYSNANESVTQLESFLRDVIDPGQVLIGVMYEQSKGTAFERGWLDIQIG